jgi:hypothetical protein
MDHKMAIHSGPQAHQSVVPCPGYAKEQTINEKHTSNGWENCQNPSGFAFFQKQSAIIAQSRNPPLGDVSCRNCGEDEETRIHIICDCGHFVLHRLNTIGVHQMPEDKPEWDMESMLQFLRKEEIILMEDC